MQPACPHLSLAPPWSSGDDEQNIALVRATDALSLCGDGAYEKVEASTAAWQLDRMSGSLGWEMERFLSRIGFRMPGSRWSGEENSVWLVARAIERQELVGVRWKALPDSDADPTIQQRKLARAVETSARGKLSLQGRTYKLVAGIDLSRLPDRDAYHVVARAEAQAALEQIAGAANPDLARLLKEACALLSRDWRPPFAPDGLVCLKRIQAPAVTAGIGQPALTPSQLWGKPKDDDIIDWTIWIELDPNDPKASDDVVILIDEFHQEIIRKPLASCARDGAGVLVVFEQINKHQRFSLIRDYGPNEGGGADTLFIDSSPAELDERGSKTA